MTRNCTKLSLNRRRFLQDGLVGASGLLALRPFSIARAAAATPRIQFAVLGGYHYHIDRMVRAVTAGGGQMAWVFDADAATAAELARKFPQARRAESERQILEDPAVALIVSAETPSERAALGMRVMRAGKDFMADKGGILSLEQLEQVKRVQAETNRIYSISYNEHLLDLGTVEAIQLARAGAIGKVARTVTQSPHGLKRAERPAWWFTQAGRGGIFTDIGTHQCCDFLQFTGTTGGLEVRAARAGNRENPQHPEFEDFGEADVHGNGGVGRIEVSWVEKSKPRTLLVEGAEGRLEILKSGEIGGKLILTTARDTRSVDLKQTVLTYGPRLVDDVLHRTQTAMAQSQTFLATELALRLQEAARRRATP